MSRRHQTPYNMDEHQGQEETRHLHGLKEMECTWQPEAEHRRTDRPLLSGPVWDGVHWTFHSDSTLSLAGEGLSLQEPGPHTKVLGSAGHGGQLLSGGTPLLSHGPAATSASCPHNFPSLPDQCYPRVWG